MIDTMLTPKQQADAAELLIAEYCEYSADMNLTRPIGRREVIAVLIALMHWCDDSKRDWLLCDLVDEAEQQLWAELDAEGG